MRHNHEKCSHNVERCETKCFQWTWKHYCCCIWPEWSRIHRNVCGLGQCNQEGFIPFGVSAKKRLLGWSGKCRAVLQGVNKGPQLVWTNEMRVRRTVTALYKYFRGSKHEELRRGQSWWDSLEHFFQSCVLNKATIICLHVDNKSRTERNCMRTSQSHWDIVGKERFCLVVVREDRNLSHIRKFISVSVASGEGG